MTHADLQLSSSVDITTHSSESNLSSDLDITSGSDTDLPARKQRFTAVWFHDTDVEYTHLHSMQTRLDEQFGSTKPLTDMTEFFNYLQQVIKFSEMFFVLSGECATPLSKAVLKKSNQCKVHIFQFPTDSTEAEHEMNRLFETISRDIEICNNSESILTPTTQTRANTKTHTSSFPPMTVFSSDPKQESFRYWNGESKRFLWIQAFNQCIAQMKHKPEALRDMFIECRRLSVKDALELLKIVKFEKEYTPSQALNYYTKDSFLFRHVNAAFRSEAPEQIFMFRPYIHDVHEHLDEGHEQENNSSDETLYRGKKIQSHVLQQLKGNIGQFVSMNGFFSTTTRKSVAQIYAGVGQERPGYHTVIFEIYISAAPGSIPHASVEEVSQFPEEHEVLFSMGSVWLLESVVEPETNGVWIVRIRSSDATSSNVNSLLAENFPDGCDLLSLGDILHELTNDQITDDFYAQIVDGNELIDEQKAEIHCKRAHMRIKQKNYQDAILHLEKAANLLKQPCLQLSSSSQLLLAQHGLSSRFKILYNIGKMCQQTKQYEKALKHYLQAVREPNGIVEEYAEVWHQLGVISCLLEKYKQARNYYSKAVDLASDTGLGPEYKCHLESVDKLLQRLRRPWLPTIFQLQTRTILLIILLAVIISFLLFWLKFPGEL